MSEAQTVMDLSEAESEKEALGVEAFFAVRRIKTQIDEVISTLELDERIEAINQIRALLHDVSPFKSEPVDFVKWVKNTDVKANDYNPNSVAPPEMKLLERSIDADGFTQPIVSWVSEGTNEVIDGFHRHRVGKESEVIQSRVKGYLPIVSIRDSQEGKNDRVASTIRHNRARGKHRVEAMSDIVLDLKRRNWSNKKIANELGMDQDEVLRLAQITGLAEMFKDKDFSEAWSAETLEDSEFEGDHEALD
jgi:ParB-like chromosome segregation protein Spo0J